MDSQRVYHQHEVDQLEEVVKYVRLANGFRFCSCSYFGLEHRNLVKEGETAISAGTISISPDFLRMEDDHSMTLKLYAASDDKDLLSKLFNKPFKDRWE